MGTATLFGDADTLKRPAPFVARRLKRLGVPAERVAEMDAKAAFALLDRLEAEREAESGPAEPDRPYPGGSLPERLALAASIEESLRAGLCGERLLSALEVSLYGLDGPGLAALANGFVRLLLGERPFPFVTDVPDRVRVSGGLGI